MTVHKNEVENISLIVVLVFVQLWVFFFFPEGSWAASLSKWAQDTKMGCCNWERSCGRVSSKSIAWSPKSNRSKTLIYFYSETWLLVLKFEFVWVAFHFRALQLNCSLFYYSPNCCEINAWPYRAGGCSFTLSTDTSRVISLRWISTAESCVFTLPPRWAAWQTLQSVWVTLHAVNKGSKPLWTTTHQQILKACLDEHCGVTEAGFESPFIEHETL